MSSTAKDYIATAKLLREVAKLHQATTPGDAGARIALDMVARGMADQFAANPRFDRVRFLDACKVYPGS